MIFTNAKKAYFKNLYKGVEKMIWDLEFKGYKTREIREQVRVQYDDHKAKLDLLEKEIKSENENPTMEKGDIARLEDQKVILTRDSERLLNQLKQMDLDVNGSRPTSDYPEGVTGITQQLDSLHELKLMVRDYIKTL